MIVTDITHIKPWCNVHQVGLRNFGNGRFLYPTSSDEPQANELGFWEVDFSEYSCPEWDGEPSTFHCDYSLRGLTDA